MINKYTITRTTDSNKDELYHWKYIKREKRPNGKWRYYYDQESLKKDVKDASGITAKENMSKIKNNISDANKEYENLSKMLRNKQISTSEYQNRIHELESKLYEASFDYGLTKSELESVSKELSKDGGWNLDDISALKPYVNKTVKARDKKNNIEKSVDTYNSLINENKKNELILSSKKMAKKRDIDKLVKEYANNKSVYDRSLVGHIDKGKKYVTELLSKVNKRF